MRVRLSLSKLRPFVPLATIGGILGSIPARVKRNTQRNKRRGDLTSTEVVASWEQAQLIKYLDGKLELKGGSREDRIEAREWVSMFLNDAVVREA
jgi:hypothetical protein